MSKRKIMIESQEAAAGGMLGIFGEDDVPAVVPSAIVDPKIEHRELASFARTCDRRHSRPLRARAVDR
jgi:hypothetical protein